MTYPVGNHENDLDAREGVLSFTSGKMTRIASCRCWKKGGVFPTSQPPSVAQLDFW